MHFEPLIGASQSFICFFRQIVQSSKELTSTRLFQYMDYPMFKINWFTLSLQEGRIYRVMGCVIDNFPQVGLNWNTKWYKDSWQSQSHSQGQVRTHDTEFLSFDLFRAEWRTSASWYANLITIRNTSSSEERFTTTL